VVFQDCISAQRIDEDLSVLLNDRKVRNHHNDAPHFRERERSLQRERHGGKRLRAARGHREREEITGTDRGATTGVQHGHSCTLHWTIGNLRRAPVDEGQQLPQTRTGGEQRARLRDAGRDDAVGVHQATEEHASAHVEVSQGFW